MQFNVETKDDFCDVVVEGELTIYKVNEFKKELEKVIKTNSHINLNLADVSEIDTSCFQLLMQAQVSCLENDKEFKLTSVSPAIKEIMEILGLERHFGAVGNMTAN